MVFGENGDIYYSEFTTQRLCKLNSEPVTPEGDRYRYADGVVSKDGGTIYCVREDHDKPEPKNVVNEVVKINVKDGSMVVLATGNDFYAAPRLSPDGKKLAYITWNHVSIGIDANILSKCSFHDMCTMLDKIPCTSTHITHII